MRRYREYKKTEYDWLQMVPKHWDHITIRSLMQLSNTRCKKRPDLELLSVYREYGVIKKSSREDNHNKVSLDISNYKYVGKNFVVMNKMKMWQGSLGVSAFEGIVSPAYIVCTLRKDLNSRYLNFLLRSHLFKTFYNRISYGIRVGQWDLRYDNLKTLNLFLPPREEQDQIVRYLDTKVGKINKLIGIKQQQIALLKKKKQAIINQAVTKGLDPNAPMKDSGIAWIGQIPEGWAVHKMSRIAKIKSNLVDPKDYPDCIQVAPDRIEKNTGRLFPCDTVKDVGIISPNHYFEKGQILYSKIRPLLNKATIAPFDGLCSADMYPLETKIDTRYFLFYLLSFSYTSQLGISGNRVKMPKINKEEFYAKLAIVPPKKEQQAIVSFIEEKTKGLDKVEASLGEATRILTEYRTRLISDVVTGKVDVRNIPIADADTLPEMEADVTLEDDWDDSEITAEECQ